MVSDLPTNPRRSLATTTKSQPNKGRPTVTDLPARTRRRLALSLHRHPDIESPMVTDFPARTRHDGAFHLTRRSTRTAKPRASKADARTRRRIDYACARLGRGSAAPAPC
jgi:hypothetical protein